MHDEPYNDYLYFVSSQLLSKDCTLFCCILSSLLQLRFILLISIYIINISNASVILDTMDTCEEHNFYIAFREFWILDLMGHSPPKDETRLWEVYVIASNLDFLPLAVHRARPRILQHAIAANIHFPLT